MKTLIGILLCSCRPALLAILFLVPFIATAQPLLALTKSVDNPTPMPGEPVEFTVEIKNIGDETALDVVVQESLPSELVIPASMAAFPGSGSYDPETGEWAVGALGPGAGSVLTVPAIVDTTDPPACIVNTASATYGGINDTGQTTARAAVRMDAAAHCVDIAVSFGLGVAESLVMSECDRWDHYSGDVTITNVGPDTARDIVVTLSQDPVIGPNLRFQDPDCSNVATAQCRIESIAPGENVVLDVTSDLFQSYEPFTQTISVLAETTDIDYNDSNNNPSDTGSAGGFSNCDLVGIDGGFFGSDSLGIGPACFIATAAYGSSLDSHVNSLRDFRDRFLMTNQTGRNFIAFYYRYSPPIAEYIAVRPWLRTIVRSLLTPLVYAIAYPVQSLLIWLLLVIAVVGWRRRRIVPSDT